MRTRWIVLFAAFAVQASTISSFARPSQAVYANASSAIELDQQVVFRRLFGLTDNRDEVIRIDNDPTSNGTEFGVPLTPAELRDLRGRGAVQEAISAFQQDLPQRIHGFAGFYVDQPHGGELVVMVTGSPRSEVDDALRSIPPNTRARVEFVRSDLESLRALQAKVDGDRATFAAIGITVTSVRADIPTNQVVVGLHPYSSVFAATLAKRYPGAHIIDEPGAQLASCVSRSNCANPLKAGLALHFSNGADCTSNYVAGTGGTGANIFLMSAAHCAPIGTSAYHNGVKIGSVTRRSWSQGGYTDSLAIDVADSQKSNLLYITNDSFISITARQSPTADYVGQTICQSGVVSTVRCGTLADTDDSQSFGGVLLYHLRRVAGMVVKQGDSGAPTSVYQTGIATGVIDGSDYDLSNPIGWYTHAYWAEYFLNLYICRSTACTNF